MRQVTAALDLLNPSEVAPKNPGVRQPISGTLVIKILAEQNLAYSEDSEISVLLQIDGVTRGHPFKAATSDRRMDHFREEVTRANEMELLVVAQGRERGGLIGLLWIPLNEIADELRRRAQGNVGWCPADPQGRLHPAEDGRSLEIEDWFKLEPAGKLLLRIGFGKACTRVELTFRKGYRSQTSPVRAGPARGGAQGQAPGSGVLHGAQV